MSTGLDQLDSPATTAQRAIHANDVSRLQRLLSEHPALLSWRSAGKPNGLLGFATEAYGDAFGEQRERWFTRAACAEALIDAGAVVTPAVVDGLLRSRAQGLLHLFHRKGLVPRSLKFHAALGHVEAIRESVTNADHDPAALTEAFICACRFHHEPAALLLLEHVIAADPELGRRIDAAIGRREFVRYAIEPGLSNDATGLWPSYVMKRVSHAIDADDLTTFVSTLRQEPWLLGDDNVEFQARLIAEATLNGRGEFINALLDLEPALLRRQPPPPSQAIEFALTYGKTQLVPLLTRIWPLPDDLPHAAGMGDLARVTKWFDATGAPALGDLERHYPNTSLHLSKHDDLHWGAPTAQHVLDTALAWSVINRHFDVADFLLAHGANINTDWNSHEPASILHHLVFLPDPYDAMQFLIDRGIDMTIKDYRWDATAEGWARFGNNDEKMARWLADMEKQRPTQAPAPPS